MPLTYTLKNGLNDNFCVLYTLSQLKNFFKKESGPLLALAVISWDSFYDHANVSWAPLFLKIYCML